MPDLDVDSSREGELSEPERAAPPQGKASRAITIKDVARLSGVSIATVTRALQGHPRVLPSTRYRVEEAAAALGYRPHFIARALATGTSDTIGLIIPSTGDRFWGEVAAAIEQRAAEAGFSVLFANSHGDLDRERRMVELFLGKRVDGIVVAAALGDSRSWFSPREAPLPVVHIGLDEGLRPQDLLAAQHLAVRELLGSTDAGPDGLLGSVSFDDIEAARTAVRHLLELGHSQVAFVGAAPLRSAVLRLIGFRAALDDAGLRPATIVECEETLEGGRMAALKLLARPRRPTALVAYDDLVAIGVMRGAHALGLRVPEDASVIGFDDIDIAAFVEPPLTTVRQPKAEMGRLAVEILLQSLGGAPPSRCTLPGTLVVRSSTGSRP